LGIWAIIGAKLGYLRLVLGLLVSGAALALALREVDLGAAFGALGRVRPEPAGLALLLVLGSIGARAYRWQALFPPKARPPAGRLFNLVALSYLVNNLLPGRAGDLARVGALAYAEKLPFGLILTTVVVEKLLDLAATVAVVGLLAGTLPIPPALAGPVRWAAVPTAAGLVSLGLFGRFGPGVLARLRLPALVRPLADLLAGAAAGAAVLTSARPLALAVFWSAVVWGLNGLVVLLLGHAFGVGLSFGASLLLIALVSLAMLVPASPGYIGVYHLSVVVVLELFGADRNRAFAFALGSHLLVYVFGLTLFGLVGLWREALDPRLVFGFGRKGGLPPAA